MKRLRGVIGRINRYLRVDLQEIVLPPPLENPPDHVPLRKLTWREEWGALRFATRLYLDTWNPPKPEVKDKDAKEREMQKESSKSNELSLLEEFTMTAKSSAGLQPAFMKLYRGQISAFQQAIMSFIEGYREGVAERVDLWNVLPTSQSQESAPTQSKTAPVSVKSSAEDSSFPSLQQEEGAEPKGTTIDEPLENLGAESKLTSAYLSESNEVAAAGSSPPTSQSTDTHAGSSEASSGDAVPSLREESQGDATSGKEGRPLNTGADANSSDIPDSLESVVSSMSNPTEAHSTAARQKGSDSPEVLQALDHAEELARALFEPGGITASRRKELEAAIADAEAALQAETGKR